jgi:hypothetical protein
MATPLLAVEPALGAITLAPGGLQCAPALTIELPDAAAGPSNTAKEGLMAW